MVGLMVKNLPACAGDVIGTDSIPGSGRSLEECMANLSSILPRESHGQRNLVDYNPWDCKELDTTEMT